MGKLIRRPDIWISLALFLLMIPAERMELFSSMENWLQGNRHIIRLNTLDADKTQFAYDDIIIVDTEEKFFDEYGSWPLKRSDIAKLTTLIKKLGAEVTAPVLPELSLLKWWRNPVYPKKMESFHVFHHRVEAYLDFPQFDQSQSVKDTEKMPP